MGNHPKEELDSPNSRALLKKKHGKKFQTYPELDWFKSRKCRWMFRTWNTTISFKPKKQKRILQPLKLEDGQPISQMFAHYSHFVAWRGTLQWVLSLPCHSHRAKAYPVPHAIGGIISYYGTTQRFPLLLILFFLHFFFNFPPWKTNQFGFECPNFIPIFKNVKILNTF